MKLFYILLGASVKGRIIEQHDVFFGIAEKLKDLVPYIKASWPEAEADLHLDAYQEVKFVDGYEIKIVEKTAGNSETQLFFINLGGYKSGFFEEFHEQHLMAGKKLSDIIKRAKQTEFYKTMGFPGAVSHIDDKYGVDIDDVFKVNDILPQEMKDKYSLVLEKSDKANQINFTKLKYLKIEKI